MPAAVLQESSHSDAELIANAVRRALELLQLSQQELSCILHVSSSTASRLAHGQAQLEPGSAPGQFALQFLRAFRSLDTLVGGNMQKAAVWMRAHNNDLDAIPLKRMGTLEGLANVAEYLDAMRGKA